jgi:hypothetical protein
MKIIFKTFLLLMLAGFLFTACKKENVDDIVITEDPTYEPEKKETNNLLTALRSNSSEGLDLGCITVVYPFELELASGDITTISSESDFEDAENGTGEEVAVDFVFPLSVINNEDGEAFDVNNNTELGIAFASCIPDDGWDYTETGDGTYTIPAFLFEELCFDLVYPIDVMDGDENTYTANNEAELIDLIATTSNLSFVLPITVVDEAGEETVIENVAGFYDLYYNCEGVTPPGTEGGNVIDLSQLDTANCDFDSLIIQYPYEVVTADGELITVEDENQEAALILSGEEYTIQYPFSLVDADGTVTTINSEEEFIELVLPCFITVEEPSDPCDFPTHALLIFNQGTTCGYQLAFPFQVEASGVVYDINEMNDYWSVYNSEQLNDIFLIYPVSVTLNTDGSTVTLNSDDEVCTFVQDSCG